MDEHHYNPCTPNTCGHSMSQPRGNLTFYDGLRYCNALSGYHGYEPCYELSSCYRWPEEKGWVCDAVKQKRRCSGFRLPTEVELAWSNRSGAGVRFADGWAGWNWTTTLWDAGRVVSGFHGDGRLKGTKETEVVVRCDGRDDAKCNKLRLRGRGYLGRALLGWPFVRPVRDAER